MKGFDLFGSQILFRFQGQSSRKTIFGSWFSLLIVVIIGIRLAFIIAEVWERRSPQVIYSERQVNSPAAFEFSNATVRYAFGMQNPNYEHYIDPSIYNLTISTLKKTMVYNSETKLKDAVYESTEFTPKKCTLEYFAGTENQAFFETQSYNDMYCFSLEDKFVMEGDFSQDVFQFFSITVKRCAGSTCATETEIDESLKNGYFAMYYTDVIVSPENKTSPFEHYARDNFWIVNQDSPKLVDFYFRNTYIESDFGWIYEDTITQRFAQFSVADVQYMPENSVGYNFRINLRFEKQKENLYKRKYKNINSIISEIGGFSQTMLAVGFILCTRFSQLELNKEIINRAFHFEDTDKTQYQKQEQQSVDNHNQQKQSKQLDHSQHQQQHTQIAQSQHYQTPQQNQQMTNSIIKQNKSVNFQLNEKQLPNLTSSSVAIPKSHIKKHAIAGVANQMMLGVSVNMQDGSGQQLQQHLVHQVPDVSNCQSQNLQLSVPGTQFRNQQQQQQQQNNISSVLGPSKLIELPDSKSFDQKKESHALMLSTIIQQKIVGLRAKNEGAATTAMNSESTVIQKGKEKEQEITETHFRTLMNKFTGSMTLNVWEYIKFFVWPFGKVKEKKQIIDYSIDKLYYHLDVLNVVKKMLEIDKLKRLIMDEDQLNLFECWPKPLIRSAEALGQKGEEEQLNPQNSPSDFLYRDVRSDMEKTQLAYLSYLRIRRKNGLKPLDERILKLMDKNLVRLFELNLHDGIPADVLGGTADIGHGNVNVNVNRGEERGGDEYISTMPQVLTSPVNNNNHTLLLTNPNINLRAKFETLGDLIKEEESEMKQQDYADTQRGMLLSPQSSQQLFTRLNEDDVLSYEDKIQIEIPIEEDRNEIKIQMFPNQK